MRTLRWALRGMLSLLCVAWASSAQATPFYSVGSGHACDTCHIEPMGWKNPKIKERYGDINPTPVWQAGADLRAMTLAFDDVSGRGVAAFPMEAQVYLAVHPTPGLTAYTDLGVRGAENGLPNPSVHDLLWVREL